MTRQHVKTALFAASLLALLALNACSTSPETAEGKRDIIRDADTALAKAQRSDSTLELPARDHGGHDGRISCHREHSRSEAFVRCASDRVQVF